MSNKNSNRFSGVRNFWEKYEKKIVLTAGFILVAIISFEAGMLQNHKFEQKPLIIEKGSNLAPKTISEGSGSVLGAESDKSAAASNIVKTGVAETANKECAFVGSKNSTKYHAPECQWSKRIKPENIVCFKNKEEAVAKGYVADKCVK